MAYTPKKEQPALTPFEIKIIQLICKELTTSEIAAKLSTKKKTYPVRTVEGYRIKIRNKIGANSLVGIVYFAIRNGIIEVGPKSVTLL